MIELNELTKPISMQYRTNWCAPSYDPYKEYGGDSKGQDNTTKSCGFLTVELTDRCNLKCVHCYADARDSRKQEHGKMQYEDWREVLENAYALGFSNIQFIGGEPTLSHALLRLINDARNIGFDTVEVFTNGTLLSSNLLDTFQKLNVNLAFSIYASQADIHDTITGQEGSFLQTIEGVRQALNYGLSLRVGVVRMQLNSRYIEDTVSFLHTLGVSTISVDDVRHVGRGTNMPESVSPINKSCADCCNDKLYIDSFGDVYPCVFAQSRVGNIAQGLQNILESIALLQYKHSFNKMN